MLIQRVLLVAACCLLCKSIGGDAKPKPLTHFRPISQTEYDAILSLTNGQAVVSEGRLIESGLAALAGMASGWVTRLRFPNIISSPVGVAQKSQAACYPLCVIKTADVADEEDHQYEYHQHQHRHSDDSNADVEDAYDHYYQQQYTTEYESHEHDDSIEEECGQIKVLPFVKCVYVRREVAQHEQEGNEDHYHTTHTGPKRSRKRHRVHAPQEPTYSYQYSTLTPSVYAGPSTAGSYNNPWYWQTPQYNSYYSDSPAHTASYPGAFPDFYTAINPSAYFGNYPSAHTGNIATTISGNNPNTYYPTYSIAHSPSTPSIAYNSQPSSGTSTFPRLEIPVIRGTETSNAFLNSIYNEQSNVGGIASENEQAAQQANHPIKFTELNTPIKYTNGASMKVTLTSTTKKRKQPAKPHSKKKIAHSQSTPTPVVGPTRTHTKAKRDEPHAQSNSYAQISSYTESGYQPTLYPQNSYASNYPKVSYTHALPYPAPVYVPNSIEQPLKMKQGQAHAVDSEEDENSAEFIQVRSNFRLS